MRNIERILAQFPKKRPELPSDLKKIFDQHYLSNRESASSNSIHRAVESWLHKVIPERGIASKVTLEVGAGNLNHLPYENLNGKLYDIIEPKTFLYEENTYLEQVHNAFEKWQDIPISFYDRILSIAVLEHMEDLPQFLALSAYNLKERGYHSHSIPCEGYPLWNLSWSITRSVPFYLKTGFSYKLIQNHEHLNTFDEIALLVKHFYKRVKIRYSYPSFLFPHLSLFGNISFGDPNYETIKKYLKKVEL